ncbi:MAG: hypothetical protein J0626_12125, partial [Rhodospirillaceae bacterium]|nr:hypothetical protein [Rhodospirillaceae bacterium]
MNAPLTGGLMLWTLSDLLKEGAVPTGELDALLSNCFRLRNARGLDEIGGGIPPATADALRAAITRTASPDGFFMVAQFLANGG